MYEYIIEMIAGNHIPQFGLESTIESDFIVIYTVSTCYIYMYVYIPTYMCTPTHMISYIYMHTYYYIYIYIYT